MTANRKIVLGILFALSGGTALVYEVVWTRLLGLMVGHTTYGLTTVLAAYMAGLGIGGYLGGKIAWRAHPLRIYAALEAGIAVAGASLGHFLLFLEPVFGWAYRAAPDSAWLLTSFRFAACGTVLLVPTVLMGMTLPVLSRQVARSDDRVGGDVGILYAANTLGAAGGSFLCGFFLLPALGMTRATLVAAAFNLLVAGAGALLARSFPPPPAEEPSTAPPAGPAPGPALPAWAPPAAIGALLLSSACAMAQQVAWVRAVGLAIGSTTYAFTLIVSVFILGLALGAAWFGRFADRAADRLLVLGGALLGMGLSSLAILPLLGRLPIWVARIVQSTGGAHEQVLQAEAVRVLLLLIVPTFFMGGVFPVVARIVTPRAAIVGRSVGDAYAASTGGSIAGSVLAGFLLVPVLGIQTASQAAGVVSLALGVVLVAMRQGRPLPAVRRAGEILVGGFAAGLLAGMIPPWNPSVVNSGPYVNAGRFITTSVRTGASLEEVMSTLPFIWWREGIDDTVAVGENVEGGLYMTVNGKPDASSEGDIVTMVLQGHLPLALHPAPRSALVIGLGSGLTAGSVALHPLEKIDIAEISRTVEEAARTFFTETNRGVLDDPRVTLLLGDARTTVGQGVGTYDVISSQPSNLYMAGVPELFTREFFTLCRERLAPGGVMGQWIHAYNLAPDDFRTAVRTFAEVFPSFSLWDAQLGSDFLLIGTLDESGTPEVSVERLAELFERPALAEDLARIAVHEPADLLGWFVTGPQALREFLGDGPVNTVDRNLLEFSVPRSMRIGPGLALLQQLDGQRHREPFSWVRGEVEAELVETANLRRYDTKRFLATHITASMGDVQQAYDYYKEITPREGPVAWRRARASLIDVIWRMLAAGANDSAAELARGLVLDDADDPQALRMWAEASYRAGRHDDARAALEAVLASDPGEGMQEWARQNLRLLTDGENAGSGWEVPRDEEVAASPGG